MKYFFAPLLVLVLVLSNPSYAETDSCDLGEEIVDLYSQAECFQGLNAVACALGALGVTYSSQKSRIGAIGLANRPGFARALAADPAAQKFVQGIDGIIKTHAAEFRTYISELKKAGPISKKLKHPTLQDKISKFRAENRGLLASSPAATQILEWTQLRASVEFMVKHRRMLEIRRVSLENERSKIKEGPQKAAQLRSLENQIRESNRVIAMWESREGLRQSDVQKLEQELKQQAKKGRIVKGAKVGALAVGAMVAGSATAAKLNLDKVAKCYPELSPTDLEILKSNLSFGAGLAGNCDSLQFDQEQLLSVLDESIQSKTPPSPALCKTLQKSKEANEKRFLADVDFLEPPNCKSGEVKVKVGDKSVSYWMKEDGKKFFVESEFIRGSSSPRNKIKFKLNDEFGVGRPEVEIPQWNSQLEGSSTIDNPTLVRSYISHCKSMKEVIESDLQDSALPQQQRCAVGRSLIAIQQTYPLAKMICDKSGGSAKLQSTDSKGEQTGIN